MCRKNPPSINLRSKIRIIYLCVFWKQQQHSFSPRVITINNRNNLWKPPSGTLFTNRMVKNIFRVRPTSKRKWVVHCPQYSLLVKLTGLRCVFRTLFSYSRANGLMQYLCCGDQTRKTFEQRKRRKRSA